MVGGEAGQGVQSVGQILSRVLARGGYHVFADQDYESRVRGGHNFFRIRVSDKKVMSPVEQLDMLICLNKETIDLHRDELKDGGIIVYDGEEVKAEETDGRFFSVPLTRLAEETAKNKLMSNTVAIGASLGIAGYDFRILEKVLRDEFERHGEEIVKANLAAA